MLEFLNDELKGIDIRVNEPLKKYTFTKVGGPADYLAFPRNRYELVRIVEFANKNEFHDGIGNEVHTFDGGIVVLSFDISCY